MAVGAARHRPLTTQSLSPELCLWLWYSLVLEPYSELYLKMSYIYIFFFPHSSSEDPGKPWHNLTSCKKLPVELR